MPVDQLLRAWSGAIRQMGEAAGWRDGETERIIASKAAIIPRWAHLLFFGPPKYNEAGESKCECRQ